MLVVKNFTSRIEIKNFFVTPKEKGCMNRTGGCQ